MEKQISLQVEPRTVRGKKVRFLRREGQVPGNVYGPGLDSIPVQAEEKALRQVLRVAGTHALVNLTIGSDQQPRQVLVRRVQQDSTTDAILHVDFHQISLDKKFTSRVPVVMVGESEAIARGGVLLHLLDHVMIECLPQDLPAVIEADLSALRTFDHVIRVGDLKLPPRVRILTDGEELVAKVQRPRLAKEEKAEVAVEEGAEAPAAGEPAEGSAGA